MKGLGVHVRQGYLLSRPLRADQVVGLLDVPAAMPVEAKAEALQQTP